MCGLTLSPVGAFRGLCRSAPAPATLTPEQGAQCQFICGADGFRVRAEQESQRIAKQALESCAEDGRLRRGLAIVGRVEEAGTSDETIARGRRFGLINVGTTQQRQRPQAENHKLKKQRQRMQGRELLKRGTQEIVRA